MNTRALIALALASLLASVGFAQGKPKAPNAEAAVIGSWHVDVDRFTVNGSTWAQERKKGTAISADVKSVIDQLQKLHVIFKADHTYVATGFQDGPHKGKWSMHGMDVISQKDGKKEKTVAHIQSDGSLRLDVKEKMTEYLVKDKKGR